MFLFFVAVLIEFRRHFTNVIETLDIPEKDLWAPMHLWHIWHTSASKVFISTWLLPNMFCDTMISSCPRNMVSQISSLNVVAQTSPKRTLWIQTRRIRIRKTLKLQWDMWKLKRNVKRNGILKTGCSGYSYYDRNGCDATAIADPNCRLRRRWRVNGDLTGGLL